MEYEVRIKCRIDRTSVLFRPSSLPVSYVMACQPKQHMDKSTHVIVNFFSFPFLLFNSLPFATIPHLQSCYRASLTKRNIISILPMWSAIFRAVYSRRSGPMVLNTERTTGKRGKVRLLSSINDTQPINEVCACLVVSNTGQHLLLQLALILRAANNVRLLSPSSAGVL